MLTRYLREKVITYEQDLYQYALLPQKCPTVPRIAQLPTFGVLDVYDIPTHENGKCFTVGELFYADLGYFPEHMINLGTSDSSIRICVSLSHF